MATVGLEELREILTARSASVGSTGVLSVLQARLTRFVTLLLAHLASETFLARIAVAFVVAGTITMSRAEQCAFGPIKTNFAT